VNRVKKNALAPSEANDPSMHSEMTRKRSKLKKSYIVSIEFYPPPDGTEALLGLISDHLTDRCGYGSRLVKRILIKSDRAKKISLCTSLPMSRPLEEHFVELRDGHKAKELLRCLKGAKFQVESIVTVGVVFYTFTCGVTIPSDALRFLAETALDLEISYYPGGIAAHQDHA
jgi:hypothetical protein